ncbi:MAG: hypothetical protein V1722_01365 [Candidatus Micrarchaeota archaeon]
MLLKPKNKAEFVSQIMALPPEQRKVVVLAGRHLNEGSRNIAVRNHLAWGKHGAVTVLIPVAWTPHGFWREMEKTAKAKGTTVKKLFYTVKKRADKVPLDENLIALLERAGVGASVVNLHGHPGNSRPWLSLFVQQEAPAHVKKTVTSLKHTYIGRELTLTYEQGPRSITQHPREILVEYEFSGKPHSTKTVLGARLYTGQVAHVYLKSPRITRDELKEFEGKHLPKLSYLIQLLARTHHE